MVNSYGTRLALALNTSGISRKELAALLRGPDGEMGVSVSAIGQVINGSTKQFTAENSALAAKALGVNHYWLAVGKGPMVEAEQAELRVREQEARYEVLAPSSTLAALRQLLQECDPSVRPTVAELLSSWARTGAMEDHGPALAKLLEPQLPGKRAAAA